ncbi:MAG: LuxR C-terminal-related transcriptional regulator [Pseudonocardiaceae bacterium]
MVANDALYRCGLHAILESQPDLEIVGEAQNCGAAAECLRHLDASVVLLDPRGLGTSPVAAIRALSCRPLLVLASPGGEPVDEAAALRAGASGLLVNTANPVELAAALRIVVAGYTLHLPPTNDRIGGEDKIHDAPPVEEPKELLNLTPREQEVFRLMASGFGNAEIAEMLMLGESTIKSHVQHLLTKLNIPNRVHAVIYAYQHGLVRGMRAFPPWSGSAQTQAPSPEHVYAKPAVEMEIRRRARIRPMDEPRTGGFPHGTTPPPSRYSSARRKTHSCPAT